MNRYLHKFVWLVVVGTQ
jgi:hypothetical protein